MVDTGPAASEQADSHSDFQDPARLTRWTRLFLYVDMAVPLLFLWRRTSGPRGPHGHLLPPSAVSIYTEVAIALITGILVLTWIHRANHNARRLGAAELRFTPWWAVGWYFVPVAWFWKPYQAIKEIWRASVNPSDWQGAPGSPLLRWWWGLWIVPYWGGRIWAWSAERNLGTGDGEEQAAILLADRLLDIPLALVLLAIIRAVNRMQAAHFRRSHRTP